MKSFFPTLCANLLSSVEIKSKVQWPITQPADKQQSESEQPNYFKEIEIVKEIFVRHSKEIINENC